MTFRHPPLRERRSDLGPTGRIRILLLEEDAIQKRMLREILEMDPRMDILEAAGPRQALALCATDLPGIQLALLDMEHSGADMLELVLSLKRANPRLAMLGMAVRPPDWLSDSRIRKTRAGYLQKPFDPDHLHLSIHVVMVLEALQSVKSPGRILAGMPALDASKPD